MLARLTARQKPTKTSSSAASTPSAEDEAEELLKQAEKALAEAVFPDPAIITRIESVSGTLPPGRLSARLTKTLKQLRERFTKESQASKPSFSFSRKPPATSKAPVSSQAIAEAAEAAEKAPNVPSPNSFSVSKKDGTRQEFAADDGTDIFVTDVAKSYLTFGFRASTVHLSGVTNSTLIFLPVRTSILIRNCSGLTLVAAAQQIRIHDSTDLKLHVAIRGAVIIERCSEVSVAPYKMVEGLVEKSELPVEDKWDEVQDFNWLVTTRPSPNWKKMAEDEWSEFGLNAPQ
ncbi:hypothetical protein L596_018703 [Steinernema carpocapsae]|uniref:C-CAP/cofactor C-like domain-containing protein n=1 Tax=Steinernema carpocapsae TaxID=34508 RepID=A0A4U5N6I9_STECR|nr:hypothetical protein L596_018703 [Steinernema carpocapsae]